MPNVSPLPIVWESAELAARMQDAGESRLVQRSDRVARRRLHWRDRRAAYLLETDQLEQYRHEFLGSCAVGAVRQQGVVGLPESSRQNQSFHAQFARGSVVGLKRFDSTESGYLDEVAPA